jgi:hypothetical protein
MHKVKYILVLGLLTATLSWAEEPNFLMKQYTKSGLTFKAVKDRVVVCPQLLPEEIKPRKKLASGCYEIAKSDYDKFFEKLNCRAAYTYRWVGGRAVPEPGNEEGSEDEEEIVFVHPEKMIGRINAERGEYKTFELPLDKGFRDVWGESVVEVNSVEYYLVNFVVLFPEKY